jgi:hypothetical protein
MTKECKYMHHKICTGEATERNKWNVAMCKSCLNHWTKYGGKAVVR